VQLQLATVCEDMRTLRRRDIKTGHPRKVFSNEENLNFHFDHRHSLAHNLASLYEGYTDFTLLAKSEGLVLSGRSRGIRAVFMKNYWSESGYLVFGSRNLAARLGIFEWNIALPFFSALSPRAGRESITFRLKGRGRLKRWPHLQMRSVADNALALIPPRIG
jgi:hypothetical protein